MSNKPKLEAVDSRKPSTEEIKTILQADKTEREQRALQRIRQVLEEERCVMNPVMVLANNTVVGRVEVTALD